MQILKNFLNKYTVPLLFLLAMSCTSTDKVIELPRGNDTNLTLKQLEEKLEQEKPPCQYCGGSSTKTCPSCNGKGIVPCTKVGPYWRSCNATGFIDCYQNLFEDIRSDHSNCKLCNGKKKINCTICNGKARTKCEQCAGRGIISCPFCPGQ